MIVFGDAHSPKVQYLVEGVQQSVGPEFPITGGCANKNAGQTFIYYEGEFQLFMVLAAICGAMLIIALGAFLLNIVMTVGLKGAIGIFLPAKGDPKDLLPPAPAE